MPEDIREPFDRPDQSLMDCYRQSLGAFIHDFSFMEVTLFGLLCSVAQVTDEIGLALFSGSRADALLQSIRRCYRARKIEIEPYLETALAQVSVLNGVRNIVVHYLTVQIENDEEAVLTTNGLRYPAENAKELRFSPETLNGMGRDCRMVGAVLLVEAEEIKSPGSTGDLGSEIRHEPLTWHYKSAPPDSPRRKDYSQGRVRPSRAKREHQP